MAPALHRGAAGDVVNKRQSSVLPPFSRSPVLPFSRSPVLPFMIVLEILAVNASFRKTAFTASFRNTTVLPFMIVLEKQHEREVLEKQHERENGTA